MACVAAAAAIAKHSKHVRRGKTNQSFDGFLAGCRVVCLYLHFLCGIVPSIGTSKPV